MRQVALPLVALLWIAEFSNLHAAEPRFRPALIGNGPNALINLIDTKKLMEKGQRDGLLLFTCLVPVNGRVRYYFTYRTTPGSKLLKEEVGTALLRSHFIPAIYNGERTEVLVIGTVVLLVADGKPHLRIYMNQNHDDVSKGNDFVAPQLVANSPDWAAGRYHPAAYKAAVNMQNAWIGLSITADANGNQKDLRISVEEPAGFGVGAAAKDVFAKASMDSRFPQRPSGRVYVRFHHMGRHRAYPSRGKALTGQSLEVPKLRQFALEKTAHSACVYASCALWHFP